MLIYMRRLQKGPVRVRFNRIWGFSPEGRQSAATVEVGPVTLRLGYFSPLTSSDSAALSLAYSIKNRRQTTEVREPVATGLHRRGGRQTHLTGSMHSIVALEANIAAGKTTLLESIDRFEDAHFRIVVIPEPLDRFRGLLELFYSDQTRWAFTLQMVLFLERVEHMKSYIEAQISKAPNKPIVFITERSPFADRECFAKMLHADGKMTDLEFRAYEDRFDSERIPRISTIVHLDASPVVCFGRMKKRARDAETNVTLEYLERLDAAHRRWLSDDAVVMSSRNGAQSRVPVCRVDGNGDPADVLASFLALLQRVMQSSH